MEILDLEAEIAYRVVRLNKLIVSLADGMIFELK